MPSLHIEVGCPGTWGTRTADPKLIQPEHPRARPTYNPATSLTHWKNPAPAPDSAPVTELEEQSKTY